MVAARLLVARRDHRALELGDRDHRGERRAGTPEDVDAAHRDVRRGRPVLGIEPCDGPEDDRQGRDGEDDRDREVEEISVADRPVPGVIEAGAEDDRQQANGGEGDEGEEDRRGRPAKGGRPSVPTHALIRVPIPHPLGPRSGHQRASVEL